MCIYVYIYIWQIKNIPIVGLFLGLPHKTHFQSDNKLTGLKHGLLKMTQLDSVGPNRVCKIGFTWDIRAGTPKSTGLTRHHSLVSRCLVRLVWGYARSSRNCSSSPCHSLAETSPTPRIASPILLSFGRASSPGSPQRIDQPNQPGLSKWGCLPHTQWYNSYTNSTTRKIHS